MKTLKIFLMAIATFIITSCDYYNAAMTYKDNSALEQVTSWDASNTVTSNAFDYDGKCFIKKDDTWMLLNGSAIPKIKVMSGRKPQCLEKSEILWVNRICVSMTKSDKHNLNTIACIKS